MDSVDKLQEGQFVTNYYCNDVPNDPTCRICMEGHSPDGTPMCQIFDYSKNVCVSTMIMSCASVQVNLKKFCPIEFK